MVLQSTTELVFIDILRAQYKDDIQLKTNELSANVYSRADMHSYNEETTIAYRFPHRN